MTRVTRQILETRSPRTLNKKGFAQSADLLKVPGPQGPRAGEGCEREEGVGGGNLFFLYAACGPPTQLAAYKATTA